MKKAFFAVIPALALASCSFWNAPVEEFFSYWASEAFVRDSSVKGLKQNDGAGVISVASNKNAEVILNVTNPKNFRLVMPSVGNSDMIHFGAFDSQPAAGTDYTLEQISGDTLKLTYTSQFLKKHEWGQKDLGASLTLFADDGRKFNRPYAFSIKSNTRPPETSVVLAQTTESTPHYVLCLTVSDMDTQVNGEKLHKDIAQIVINGAAFPLAINSTGSDFVKPADGSFIERTAVTQLTAPGSEAVPTAAWTLFYKTGVPTGGAYTAYTITLRDEKGLISEKLETGTMINKPAEETVTLTAGVQDSGSGTAALPFIIAPAGTPPEAQITIQCATSGTTVHCAVTDVNAGTATEYNGNPVIAPLPLNSENEKLYAVKYNTKGTGYNPTTLKTKYYKILKRHTITFSANGGKFADDSTAKTAAVLHGRMITAPSALPAQDGFTFLGWYKEAAGTTAWDFTNDAVTGDATLYAKWSSAAVVIKPDNPAEAWKKLKEEAAKASGVSVIVIDGEIKATTDSGNNGEITIGRNLTIQGKNSATSDILNANGGTFSVSDSHRIFKVTGGKTLTLKNLTLKGGRAQKADSSSPLNASGGGILLESGAVSLSHVTLSGCKAITTAANQGQGGGIYVQSGMLALENSTLSANEASKSGGGVYVEGGTFTMDGNTVITPSTGIDQDKTGKNDVYLNNGQKITVNGTLTGTLPAARITPATYMAAIQVLTGSALGTEYAKFTVTPQDLGSGKISYWEVNDQGRLIRIVDGAKALPWKQLKDAVEAAVTSETIYIRGEIQASSAVGNNGQIDIGKNLTIKGLSSTPTLNANALHRIFNVTSGVTLTLKDLTLKGGKATGTGEAGKGGAIYVRGAAVDIANCILNGNKAEGGTDNQGGAIYAHGATVNINNCTMTGNAATKDGGAVYADKDTAASTITISGGTIGGAGTDANEAEYGGGVYADKNTTVNMTNCTLKGNKADGGTDVSSNPNSAGGAVYANGATVKITNCTLTGNEAKRDGGAIFAKADGSTASNITIKGGIIGGTGTNGNRALEPNGFGGGIFIDPDCTLTAENVQIIGNKAGRAGGVRANNSTVTLTGCTVKANNAGGGGGDSGGGGVYIYRGTLAMTSCTLTGNTAENNGGGLNLEDGNFTITNCILTRNSAKNGGGIYAIKRDTAYADVTIKGGTIGGAGTDANKATGTGSNGNGGGIYVGTDCTVTLEDSTDGGVKILGNTAAKGGGVYISSMNAKFTMNGRAVVTPSTGGDKNVQGKNDVYFVTGSRIDLTGTLSPEGGIAARITPDNYNSGTQVLRGSTVSKNYIKFVVTPNGSQYWLVDGAGALTTNVETVFNSISQDTIKNFDQNMTLTTIAKYNDLVGRLIFYRTSSGNYGVMTITQTQSTGINTYNMKFKYKTYRTDGAVLTHGEETVGGTFSFDLDTGTTSSSAQPLTDTKDFFLYNSIDIQPKNNAKFYSFP